MERKWLPTVAAFMVAVMAAFTAPQALALGGSSFDEQWNENLYCRIDAETTMANPGDEVRVKWKTLDNTITGYRIHPTPHNDGFVPNTEGAGYITIGDEATLFSLYIESADKSEQCQLLISIWPEGTGPSSGPGVGPFIPPPGCVGAACNPPPPPGCVGAACNPPPPPPPPPAEKEKGNEGVGNGDDPPPPGHDENQNDGDGSSPGNPGNKGGGKP